MRIDQIEPLVRKLSALVLKSEHCGQARDILGADLKEARLIVDRLQYLIDLEYFHWKKTG